MAVTGTVGLLTLSSLRRQQIRKDWLGRQRHVWFIKFMDKRVGVQVKLRNHSTTCAIPKRFCSFSISLGHTFIRCMYDLLLLIFYRSGCMIRRRLVKTRAARQRFHSRLCTHPHPLHRGHSPATSTQSSIRIISERC